MSETAGCPDPRPGWGMRSDKRDTDQSVKAIIPNELYDRLQRQRVLTGMSMSDQVAQAIKAWFAALDEGLEEVGDA